MFLFYIYSAINKGFKVGWIPENYYWNIVEPKLKGNYGLVSDLKPLSKMLFQSELFPDIAYYINGLFFDGNQKIIEPKDIKDLLFRNSDKIIFKLDNSNRGQGIHIITKNIFTIEEIFKLGNGVFQTFINQHSFFNKYKSE